MGSTPLISVVIPVFNEEKYIDRCMESLQRQTWKLMQIILVDGGSTDGTGAKCDEWASRWNRSNMGIVEVIHTGNEGVSASRNKGLSHVSGEYVTFIDGDDWLEPGAITEMYRALKGADADMAGCDFRYMTDDADGNAVPVSGEGKAADSANKKASGPAAAKAAEVPGPAAAKAEEASGPAAAATEEASGSVNEVPAWEVLTGPEFLDRHLLHGDVHCWGRLYRTSVLRGQKFIKGLTIGEDMLFLLEYVRKCGRVVCLGSRLYDYYRNPAGAMSRPFTEHTMDQVTCWIKAGELLRSDDRAEVAALGNSPMLRSNILISVMLTAGRLSAVEKKTRRDPEHRKYAAELKMHIKDNSDRDAVKETGKIPGGYPLKLRLFGISPQLYMDLYHGTRKNSGK